eukprot:TRINITY_DN12616_c0_g1_i3.p1 TRINITY_DN12616_c0_g1~~TRINITY_DN12616_c0_g1_i3.p1  ORF type:complete len:126 (-),score=6.30 TRINITY_DN12616_c0_g1_i3:159-536(-)
MYLNASSEYLSSLAKAVSQNKPSTLFPLLCAYSNKALQVGFEDFSSLQVLRTKDINSAIDSTIRSFWCEHPPPLDNLQLIAFSKFQFQEVRFFQMDLSFISSLPITSPSLLTSLTNSLFCLTAPY